MREFWEGRRVFLTGHTGFKGAWLSLWLEKLGANVYAIALEPEEDNCIYNKLEPWRAMHHHIADIRDGDSVAAHMKAARPEIVIHMAAQALVRRSYADPANTFATNVMGTVNILEAAMGTGSVRSVLVVTSDKVYLNEEHGRPFKEDDRLGGADPYSNSKACAELICQSYRKSFFLPRGIRLVTARAGNVIGGGDRSADRLVPDLIRSFEHGEAPVLRYPDAVRPWQHVLEPLGGYLRYAQAITEQQNPLLPDAINLGPESNNFASVSDLANAMGLIYQSELNWIKASGDIQPEAQLLMLDSALSERALGWKSVLDFQQTIGWTAAWYQAERNGLNMREFSLGQLASYEHASLLPKN